MFHGTITKSTGSNYTVFCRGNLYSCRIRGKLRLNNLRTTNPVAVGDVVNFELQDDGIGVINDILPRKNYIIRRSTNLSKESHIIAANMDQCMLVTTLFMPETPLEFVDRFLVTAEVYKVPAILVFNKVDLYANSDSEVLLKETMNIYEKIGYKCLAVSSISGQGIDELRFLMKDKTTLLSGNSGTGKSTLINTLSPGLNLRTSEISQVTLSGKHTTTFAEMFDLSFGGKVIDTPGIKGFGIVGLKQEDIAHNFPEIFGKLEQCRFYNCTHVHEPGCAVKQAVEDGEIAQSRYHSYISILEQDDSKYRKDEYL